jgi:hypothetical protein
VTDRHCPVCDDRGWVCETHPDRPWRIVSDRWDACDCGTGAPCTSCNRYDENGRPDISRAGSKVIFDDTDGERLRNYGAADKDDEIASTHAIDS